jgi:quercetin dioxygenase-like cupin family protein
MLGFSPRASTPLHTHPGLTLVGVLDGDMTVRSRGIETVYPSGDLWVEQPGDVHTAGNDTANDARVAVTFLMSRGAPVTTLVAAQVAPAQVP